MTITAEQARMELRRRAAQAELERRRQNHAEATQGEGFGRSVARSVGRAAKNIGVGALDFADLVTTLPSNINRAVGQYAASKYKHLGGPFKALAEIVEELPEKTPIAETSHKKINEWTGGHLEPKTDAEKNIDAIYRGVGNVIGPGGLAKLAATKGAPMAAKLLGAGNALTPGNIATSGAMSGVAQHMLNQNPEDVSGAMLASLGTGIGMQGAQGAKRLVKQGANKLFNINPEKLVKIQESGLPLTLGDVSDTPLVKKAQNALYHMTPFDNELARAYQAAPEKVKQSLGIAGASKTPNDLIGELSKGAINTYENRASTIYENLQDKALEALHAIPGGDKVPLNQTREFIRNYIANVLEHEPEMIQSFAKTPVGQINREFITPMAARHEGAIGINPLKAIRTKAGKKGQGAFGQISDEEKGMLKNLYGKLSEDIGAHIYNMGGEGAKKAWDLSNKVWGAFKGKAKTHLNPFLKAVEKNPESAPHLVINDLNGGGELFKTISHYMPAETKRHFTNNIIYNIGEKGGEFNYGQFATKVGKMSEHGQDELFKAIAKNTGASVKSVANMMDVIDYAKGTLAHANNSQTAYHQALIDMTKKIAHAGVALGAGSIAGLPAAIITPALAWGANKYMFANPKFIEAIAYTNKINKRSQLPVWVGKLRKVPGMPDELVNTVESLYKAEKPLGATAKSSYRTAQEYYRQKKKS